MMRAAIGIVWEVILPTGGVLVWTTVESTDTVQPDAIDGIRCREDGGEDLLPGASDSPFDQLFVSGLERAELVGWSRQVELFGTSTQWPRVCGGGRPTAVRDPDRLVPAARSGPASHQRSLIGQARLILC